MACRLDGAKPLSEPMLEYHIYGTNFSEILIEIQTVFIEENTFENVVCEILPISTRPQWVNTKCGDNVLTSYELLIKRCTHSANESSFDTSFIM